MRQGRLWIHRVPRRQRHLALYRRRWQHAVTGQLYGIVGFLGIHGMRGDTPMLANPWGNEL